MHLITEIYISVPLIKTTRLNMRMREIAWIDIDHVYELHKMVAENCKVLL